MYEYVEHEEQSLLVVDSVADNRSLTFPRVSGEFKPSIDQMVAAWLHSKYQRSLSPHTLARYERHVADFRGVLHTAGIDLDGDVSLLATIAQGWAGRPMLSDSPGTKQSVVNRYKRMEDGGVSAATYNGRIVSISSFYEYAIRHGWLASNPMKMVEPRRVASRDYARPFSAQRFEQCLARIDRSTLLGMRDYAMLLTWVMTGRRIAEIAGMSWVDIIIDEQAGTIIVRFPRCKGGKSMEDQLQPRTAAALLSYLRALHGDELQSLPPDTPVWVRLADNIDTRGRLQVDALRHICIKRLGTGKSHAIRHTFAVGMEQAGAKLSDIGARLGHSNLATTSIYMQRFHGHENPFAAALEAGFTENTSSPGEDLPPGLTPQGKIATKRERVELAIREHPELSNAALGKLLGVDEATISRHRKRLGKSRAVGTNQYSFKQD